MRVEAAAETACAPRVEVEDVCGRGDECEGADEAASMSSSRPNPEVKDTPPAPPCPAPPSFLDDEAEAAEGDGGT